ncbi:hypothetical protein Droror1_Dr00010166 [Drosera rotundifolia]
MRTESYVHKLKVMYYEYYQYRTSKSFKILEKGPNWEDRRDESSQCPYRKFVKDLLMARLGQSCNVERRSGNTSSNSSSREEDDQNKGRGIPCRSGLSMHEIVTPEAGMARIMR